jgi:hypothetical protein
MMSFTELERQALGSIADGLAGSDPRLASMLNIFSRLVAGEEMPAREKTRIQGGRPTAHRPRQPRRHPRRGTARPQPRRLYPRLGWPRSMLLLWAVTTAALFTIALLLNTSGHNASTQSVRTACPSAPSGSGPASTYGWPVAAMRDSTRQRPPSLEAGLPAPGECTPNPPTSSS